MQTKALTTLENYRPTDKEPFMREREREYFCLKLLTFTPCTIAALENADTKIHIEYAFSPLLLTYTPSGHLLP